jgi:molybdenum cofactor synthesis domain-containing protein
VIRREDVIEHADGTIGLSESTLAKCTPGLAVRRMGENAPTGSPMGLAAREISAPIAAALASAGVTHPHVHAPVRVAILTTGDELVGFDQSPGPWQLRDSNGPALAALIARRRWLEVTTPHRVHDDPAAAFEMARELLATHDCLLLTGGVSMGHRDFVPSMVESLGATTICHKLPQRPGKPLLVAAHEGKLIAGLPGNPQSVMVTARRVVLPILSHMAGSSENVAAPQFALLGPTTESLPLWWYRPATIDASGVASPVSGRGSGDIVAAGRSDGFVELRPNQRLATPTLVPWYRWAW